MGKVGRRDTGGETERDNRAAPQQRRLESPDGLSVEAVSAAVVACKGLIADLLQSRNLPIPEHSVPRPQTIQLALNLRAAWIKGGFEFDFVHNLFRCYLLVGRL